MRTEVHDQRQDLPPRAQQARAGRGREETDQPWDEPRSTWCLVLAHAARSLAASQPDLRWPICDAKMARRPIVAALATILALIASAESRPRRGHLPRGASESETPHLAGARAANKTPSVRTESAVEISTLEAARATDWKSV